MRVVRLINLYAKSKSKESGGESGVELKIGGNAVLSKNSFGKEDSKYLHLFLNGLASVELEEYSYLKIKISVL